MKRLFFTCGLMIACTVAALAQPKAIFDKKVEDMGNVQWKRPASATFTVTNKGNKPLVIAKVSTTCGCTAVEWTEKPIQAGKKGSVVVTYDAKMMGHFSKGISVYCNADTRPLVLKIEGDVVKRVLDYSKDYPYGIGSVRLDRYSVEFEDANKGEKKVAYLKVVNTSKKAYVPTLMHLPKYVTAEAIPESLGAGQEGVIKLTLNSACLMNMGLTQSSVYLARFPGDKVGEDNEVVLSAVLLPDFSKSSKIAQQPRIQLSKNELDFGSLGNRKQVSEVITITNTGSSTLDIRTLQVFNSSVTVELSTRTLAPSETAKMKIGIVAKYLKKAKTRPSVLMITNDPKRPKVIIPIKVKH